jgi:2-oxoglutarate dehydrogenase E1 component
LNHLARDAALFQAFDSPLSEVGVLGFEYGYALARPRGIVIWEAQFGDFINNAQAVIDLYITGGESKWQRLNGLVLLLPHGHEGMGPEHSSARPERFLQLCADDNLQVCNLTTPAQYFHLLRRQALCTYRKPLVVLTPKSLLRHPLAVSPLKEMASGGFKAVLDDTAKGPSPERVLVCSGKIYYELFQKRRELKDGQTAIIRLEQFYPFPETQLAQVVAPYRSVKQWRWVQEEPENMGPWQFIAGRIETVTRKALTFIGRPAAASPATGFSKVHKQEQAAIVEKAFKKSAL